MAMKEVMSIDPAIIAALNSAKNQQRTWDQEMH
jgi:hypothetical protein